MVDVDVIKCDLCGAVARHVVTKEFNGVVKNFPNAELLLNEISGNKGNSAAVNDGFY